jgi:hypothetical protein
MDFEDVTLVFMISANVSEEPVTTILRVLFYLE